MVAPNSPSALAKHSTMPAMMPGSASGSVTVRNDQQRGWRRASQAASSSRRSIASNDSRIARTSSGKPITPQASAAPVQRNENTMPKVSARNAPIDAAPAERDQQQIAGDDRRQHQRQMHDAVEQRLAPEILARQQPRDRDAERQRHEGRDQRDPQRQRDRGPFSGVRSNMREHVERDPCQRGVITTSACTRNVKPYFSKIAFAAPRAQEVEIPRGLRLGVHGRGDRIDDRRMRVRREVRRRSSRSARPWRRSRRRCRARASPRATSASAARTFSAIANFALDRRPDAELLQRGLGVFADRHRAARRRSRCGRRRRAWRGRSPGRS